MRRAPVLGYILARLRKWEVGREGRQRRRKRMIRVECVWRGRRVGGGDKTKKKRKRFERLMRQNLAEPWRAEPRAISWDVSDVAVLPFEFWPHFVCFVFFLWVVLGVFFVLWFSPVSIWRTSLSGAKANVHAKKPSVWFLVLLLTVTE